MADVQSEVIYVNPDDTRTIPSGDRGTAHLTVIVTGPQGIPGLNGLPGEDGDDGWTLPGPQGLQGPQGTAAQGPPGEDADDYGWPIPGTQGPQGVLGPVGFFGPPGEDADDYGWPIPGTQGIQGVQGIQGIPGVGGASGQPLVTTTINLPPNTNVPAGQMAFVTDSVSPIATASGTILVGGGTFFVPVYNDGTNWILWAGGTQGPVGPAGAAGAAGANGTNGTNGSNGSGYALEAAFTTPPAPGSWAHTGGDAAFSSGQAGGGAGSTSTYLKAALTGTDTISAYLTNDISNAGAGGASGFKATFRFRRWWPVHQWSTSGLIISDGTNFEIYGMGDDGSYGLNKDRFTARAGGGKFNTGIQNFWGGPTYSPQLDWWLRYHDDTTNRIIDFSWDGVTWFQAFSEGRTTSFTATQIGFGFNANVNGFSWLDGKAFFECYSYAYLDF